MDFRRSGRLNGPLLLTLLCFVASPAFAGGNHHKTVLIPVQTVSVQTTQVQAAASVQLVQVQAAAPMQFVQVQAAAPIQYVQAQAAAPIQYMQAQAAAPIQYVQAQAAAPIQYVTTQAAAPVKTAGAAPVAGAAPTSAKPTQVNMGGVIYNLVPANGASPSIGAAPTDIDGISNDEQTKILAALAPFVTTYKGLISDDSVLSSTIRSKAGDIYARVTGNDKDSADASKPIDAIVAQALGKAPSATDGSTAAATATATVGQVQQLMVPVTAAAPVQLFLPVKVKHHGHLSW